MSATQPRVFIAHTGGTVGMMRTRDGYQPARGHLEELLTRLPQFQAANVPEFRIHEFEPLLDSSDMTPRDWLRIAEVIRDHYAGYDGFLVLHGTDTMAFTAAALSFMLEKLSKPVLITGSQIPLEETRNDALENLLTSLILLGEHHHRLSEVFIYFDNRLFRGNRVTKVSADSFSAFDSPNFPAIGTVGIDIDIDWELARPPRVSTRVDLVEIGAATVTVFRLFPGLKAGYLESVLAPPVQGVVLECFGSGNAPGKNRDFLEALKAATTRGVVIVAVTQPLQGTADLERYATGRALAKVGVVSGYDMTTEAALAKLFYLFEKGHPAHEVKALIQRNLRGELTPPEDLPGVLRKLRRGLTPPSSP